MCSTTDTEKSEEEQRRSRLKSNVDDLFGDIPDMEEEWRSLYESARDPSTIDMSEDGSDEDPYGFQGNAGSNETRTEGRPRMDMRSAEKREMYDLYVQDPEKHSMLALSRKYRVTMKTVKAVLKMQRIVREAEAAGEVQPEEDTTKLRTWEEYTEWMNTLDEKTRNQYRDGPFGRFKREADFLERDESIFEEHAAGKEDNWKEHEGINAEEELASQRDNREQPKYPTFLSFNNEEEAQTFKDEQLAKVREVMDRDMPEKSIAPRLLDPNYGISRDGRHKYRTIFQDISEVSSTRDQYKILGILDHDGTFRPPTDEELRHRYKRMTPAKLKKTAKRAMSKRRRSKAF
eukprot:g2941.t1